MKKKLNTLLAHLGRNPSEHEGFINPPIQRGSTIIINEAKNLYSKDIKSYGLEGASTQDRLCEALTGLIGGVGTVLCPSGLAAINLALLSFLKSGDHILVSDSVYGPTRRFCDGFLKDINIETTYYNPRIGAEIEELIKNNTKIIFLESPGSLTLELQDVPLIAQIAKRHNIITMIDDTWSAGVYMKPLELGIDISIQALTKYQSGHSDVLAGSITTNRKDLLNKIKAKHLNFGVGTSAEDSWLTLRGLRTMGVRLKHQDNAARKIAKYLENHSKVKRVIHPALESSEDYKIFNRDFTGAGGLFSFVLKSEEESKINEFLESFRIFSMGFSWGGYESLVINCTPQIARTAVKWNETGALIRLSIGLEDENDLLEDLEQALNYI